MFPHRKKMPLSNAEKQRRYRERRDRDPQRRAEYLAKSRQKYETDKSVGKRKTIAEMSDRDQRHTRRKWRLDQLNHRRKLKEHEALELIVTPPNSPDGSQHEHLNDHIPTPGPSDRLESPQNPGPSRQMQAARKNKAKKKSQCYRDNAKLEKKVDNLVKRVNMYKQRWIREKNKDGATPRSKTKALIRNFSLPKTREKVRKQLAFNSALVEEIRQKYQKGNRKEKNNIISIAAGRLIKRSRLLEFASQELGVSNSHGKRKKKKCLTIRLGKQIRTFFERDDLSKLTPGVKQTITRLKVKMQKRILVDSLTNLHEKFLQEHKETKISYTSFCRLRPFWVVSPTEKDRETCACKLHENIKLLVQSLNSMELLQSNDMRELVSLAVCDVEDKYCMYNDCITCGGRSLVKKERDNTKNVEWTEWTTKRETRSVKSEKKEINITVKEKQQGKLMQLVEKFDEEMARFKRHIFNIASQMRYYTELKESLNENEVLIHVDFAENYLTKMSTEIQSMHFGASKSQITLHTGVYHMKDQKNPISFCTVSDSLKHGPAAIWAYLDPVLTEIQEKYPLIDIHFFSDGPSTQYRQKNNFFLFTQELSERGLKSGTWNFHESGHGKGAPDGIGGAIKRTANRYVLHGKDITNAKEFVDSLRESQSNVVLYEVQDDMIEQKQKKIPKLKTVPGTQKIHQIVYEAECPGVIYVRDISCRCRFTDPHEQHELTKVNFPKKDFQKKDYPKKDIPKKDFPKKDFLKREKENQHTLSEPREEENQHTLSESREEENQQTLSESREEENQHSLSEPIMPPNREQFFEDCLKCFEECTTFKDLKKNCKDISRKMIIWPVDYDRLTTIVNSGLNVDQQTMDIYPDDVQQTYVTFPVSVKADWNCLPYSGSVLAFGNDRYATEIRARIIIEQTLYEEYYLQENYLKNGLDDPPKFDIKRAFAMYSDEYKHGTDRLNDKTTIQDIYEREVMKIRKRSTYMGIWQIFALSSVLQQKVFSIYPKLGNVNVRKDLHRIIHPRVNVCENRILYIMWTSTRSYMTRGHWLPNHFVPVLPIDDTVESKDQANEQQNKFENHEIEMETNVTCKNYEMATKASSENNEMATDETGENNEMTTNITSENDEMVTDETGENNKMTTKSTDGNNEMATDETGENNEITTNITSENDEMVTDETGENNKMTTKSTDGNNEMVTDETDENNKRATKGTDGNNEMATNETCEKNEMTTNITSEKNEMATDNVEENIENNEQGLSENQKNETDQSFKIRCTPSQLIGQYVVVLYDNMPYPGLVIDSDDTDVYVRCMHRVGRGTTNSPFFWPRTLVDECWYNMECVLTIIPEPIKIGRHYFIDEAIWVKIIDYLKEN